MTSRLRVRGFTLIEALAAVTLLALLFGALMPVFQQGLAVLRSGDRYTRAVLLAQSVLDSQLAHLAAAQSPASPQAAAQVAIQAAVQGEAGDYHWQVTRAPFRSASKDPAADETAAFALLEVHVVVTWPGNESGVQLHTLAMVAAQ